MGPLWTQYESRRNKREQCSCIEGEPVPCSKPRAVLSINLKGNIMTDRHLIVGAGPVGRHVAQLLAARGSEVTVATRSGTDTGIDGVTHLKLDASDADALSAAAEGVSVIYNCANPADYTTWEKFWPPLAAAFLVAAERSGAVYAITGNLYPYGPVDRPDDRGHARRGDRSQGPAPRDDVGRRQGAARCRSHPRGRGARLGLRRHGRRRQRPHHPPGAGRPARASVPGSSTGRTCRTRSPTCSTPRDC